MRSSSACIGIFSLAVFLVAGVAVLALGARNSALDSESREFVRAAVPAIFAEWDEKEMMRRASSEFQAAVSNRELRRLFHGMASQYGRLQECERIEGGASISMVADEGIVLAGDYAARSLFDAGPATIRLSLVKHGGNWQILSFRLHSESL